MKIQHPADEGEKQTHIHLFHRCVAHDLWIDSSLSPLEMDAEAYDFLHSFL